MKIIIEGMRGTGKTTLGTLLCQDLRKRGYVVEFEHEQKLEFGDSWTVGDGPAHTDEFIEIFEQAVCGRTQTKETHMKAAINELTIALKTMETNEPINRTEGRTEQADLEAANAADFRQALTVLMAATNGPIWPQPE